MYQQKRRTWNARRYSYLRREFAASDCCSEGVNTRVISNFKFVNWLTDIQLQVESLETINTSTGAFRCSVACWNQYTLLENNNSHHSQESKDKGIPVHGMNAYVGAELWLHSFETSALYNWERFYLCPIRFSSRQEPRYMLEARWAPYWSRREWRI